MYTPNYRKKSKGQKMVHRLFMKGNNSLMLSKKANLVSQLFKKRPT